MVGAAWVNGDPRLPPELPANKEGRGTARQRHHAPFKVATRSALRASLLVLLATAFAGQKEHQTAQQGCQGGRD